MTGGHTTTGGARLALLQLPSGRIAYRLPLPEPAPRAIAHAGYAWQWSHRCASGVTYARGRAVAGARVAPQPQGALLPYVPGRRCAPAGRWTRLARGGAASGVGERGPAPTVLGL